MNTWIRMTMVLGLCGSVAGSAAWAQTTPAHRHALEAAAAALSQAENAEQLQKQAAGVAADMQAAEAQAKQLQKEAAGVAADKQAARAQAEKAKQLAAEAAYLAATAAMDAGRYTKAIEELERVLEMKGPRYEGALYWKAYTENKLGLRPEALETLQQLLKERAASRWVSDARALELEIRSAGGRPVKPEATEDDNLKLLALNGLLHSHTDEAVGTLQKMLEGNEPPKTKTLALFVLSQSGSPKARQVLVEIATGSTNPDLQREALTYLGMLGSKESHQALSEIYRVSRSADVKRQILRTYVLSGDRDKLLAAARGEKDISLRVEAIRQLGQLRATTEIGQMYEKEANVAVRREIVRAFMLGSDGDRLVVIARSDADPAVRLEAVRGFVLIGDVKASAALAEIYGATGQTVPIRMEIISALFMRGDTKALAELAQKETDPELKQAIEHRLSQMKKRD